MLVLLTVNVRLLRSPTADGARGPLPSDPARSEFSYPARANSASPQDKTCTDPPGVMDDNDREARRMSRTLNDTIKSLAPMKAEEGN